MVLKGALHVHSTCSDGTMSIEEVLAVYRDMAFDFIALTDHDFLRPEACHARHEDRSINVDYGLLLFEGMEMTVFEHGYVHVNRIQGDRETLHIFNHPSELGLPVPKAIKRILSVGSRIPLDAIEVTTKGFYTPEYDIPTIPLVKVATDDSHTRLGCGRAWIELDCRADRDSIIRAIKHGDFWNCYQSGSR